MGTGPIFAGKRTVTYRGQKIKKWGLSPFFPFFLNILEIL